MSAEEPLRQAIARVKDPLHVKRVATTLQGFNVKQDFMDLVFVCTGGNKVHAHKLLICSVSESMKKIFLEVPDTDNVTVFLPDVEARILTLVIDFLYEGQIRLSSEQFTKFNEAIALLGIALSSVSKTNKNTGLSEPPAPSQSTPAQMTPTQMPSAQSPYSQPTPIYYLPATSNSQGQVQYVLATPQSGIMPGPLLSPMTQGMTQPPSSQPMIIGQNGGQMVQAAAQMVQQGSSQVVSMNSQLVQCPSEMVVQTSQPMVQSGNQSMMINNNQMQGSIQNQVLQSNQPIQQQPQYVMASNNNSHSMGSQSIRTLLSPATQSSQPHRTSVQQMQAGNSLQLQQQTSQTNPTNNLLRRRQSRAPLPMIENRQVVQSRHQILNRRLTQNRQVVSTNRVTQRNRLNQQVISTNRVTQRDRLNQQVVSTNRVIQRERLSQ